MEDLPMTESSDPNAAESAGRRSKKEILFHGIPASPGICIGKVYVFGAMASDPVHAAGKTIEADQVEAEIDRFHQAVEKTKNDILELQKKLLATLEAREASIFDAHLLIVEDKMLHKEVEEAIRAKKIPADVAFTQVIQRYIAAISAVSDDYIQERVGDVQDVADRIIRNLSGIQQISLEALPPDTVVISRDLRPSDTAVLDRAHIKGFAIEIGSKTCHTSILARSMRIPAVVGMRHITERIVTGDTVIVDGFLGMVVLNPKQETIDFFMEKMSRTDELYNELLKETSLAAETEDGFRIQIFANIEGLQDVEDLFRYGAEGVGLFRTEYLYMNSLHTLPDEETQFAVYRDLTKALKGRVLTIRTLDIGGDKLEAAVSTYHEPNPFLGLRAIRLYREKPELLTVQLRALLRASAYGDLRIMFPMICCVEEVDELLASVERTKQDLQREGKPFNPNIKIGVMIEIPSAALLADRLAGKVDFFSIGTNDLVQYTLAVDRKNEKVANLYKPCNPAVLRLIRETVLAANRNRIYVCVCGEIAGDPKFTPILLGLGVHEISMAPVAIAPVRRVVRRMRMTQAEELAKKALESDNSDDAMNESKALVCKLVPDLKTIIN